jgi:ABC-type polysaccharide/polyol phosphate transport system ATPase subunit
MTSIKLSNLSLDYIVKTGSISIKKSAIHLLNNCFRTSAKTQFPIKNTLYRALNNINLHLNIGDRVGLIGRNGAGKSTLLKVLAQIYKPNMGEIEVTGKICSLFDVSSGMNTESTGYENIVNLAIMRRIAKKNIPSIIKNVESFTELGDFLNNPIKTYSTGMLLKLAFGVATATPAEIILIDEIIGAGDAHFMEKATKRLENMIEQSHILVLASHSNEIIKQFCNKAIVLDHGQIQFFGEVENGIDFYHRETAL